MWWGRSEPQHQAWLGAGRVGWFAPKQAPQVLLEGSWQLGLAQLSRWSASLSPKDSVRIWLGSDLCRLGSSRPISSAKSIEEAQVATVSWLKEQGQLPPGWTARLAEAPTDAPIWRVTLTIDGLPEAIQKALSGRATSIQPWWSWALRQHKAGDRMVCAFDGAALVSCRWDEAGNAVLAETAGPLPDIEAARRLLRRRQLEGEQSDQLRCVQLDWPAVVQADAAQAFALALCTRDGDAL